MQAWMVQGTLNDVPVAFRIDSGADVTVIPQSVSKHYNKATTNRNRLREPGNNVLHVRGKFTARLQYCQKVITAGGLRDAWR